MSSTVVDAHSHIFNAEDVPIDGFIRKHSPLPSLVTGALSLPFDRVLAWATPGSDEAEFLIRLLQAKVWGLQGPEPELLAPPELPSDAEMEARLVDLWPLAQEPPRSGLESVRGSDPLVARIEQASPQQLAELESWLLAWGDPEVANAHEAERSGAESVTDWPARANGLRRAIARFMALLRLVSRHRHQIAARLAATYPSVELFVPALVDFTGTTGDAPATDVPDQIAIHSLVAKLSVVGGIPGAPNARFHPMVGFCPHREIKTSELVDWDVECGRPNHYVPYADPATAGPEDCYWPGLRFDPMRARALRRPTGPWESARLELPRASRSIDLVRHAVDLGGFVGVKVYPPSGFLPIGNFGRFGERVGLRLDAALRALYGYCEAMQVPIMTHAAHSIGFATGYNDFAAPTAWAAVLQDYPNLRLDFGHFGHLHGVAETGSAGPDSWVRRFVELIDKYPHVYADVGNSRMAFDEAYHERYLGVLHALLHDPANDGAVTERRRRRLMFGSDYWLNTRDPMHENALSTLRSTIESAFGEETRDWFLGGNALRFLGFTGEDDRPDLENQNRQRLVTFYGTHPLPSWLEAAPDE